MTNTKDIKGSTNFQNDIVRIEKMGNKTFMVFAEGEVSESLLTIDELERSLANKGFIRINQQHLVNSQHLKHRFDTHTKWVTLDNGDRIPLSRSFLTKPTGSIIRRFITKLFNH